MSKCSGCCRRQHGKNPEMDSIADDETQDRHYGCYRFGILIAVLIILILIVGTVPVLFAVQDSRIILIATVITLMVAGIILLMFCMWQQRKATAMRRDMAQRELDYYGQ